MKKIQCQCGEWTGEQCAWSGPASDMVVVEYMPKHLRASHQAAGNCGEWPHNGSIRVPCERGCADAAAAADPEWTVIIEGARVADYLPA
jgi:hypothetical protein